MVECQKHRVGVAIDGASFWNMQRHLGIEQVDYCKLIGVLRRLVSQGCTFCEEPRISVAPQFCQKERQLFQDLKRAGIIARPAPSYNESDDALVVRWFSRYANDPAVTDVVLITCDGWLIQQLVRLVVARRAKGDTLLRMHVVGTLQTDDHGNLQVSRELLCLLAQYTFSKFHTVESFRNDIARTLPRHR